jgi:hypothetical protein
VLAPSVFVRFLKTKQLWQMVSPIAVKLAPMDILSDRQVAKNLVVVAAKYNELLLTSLSKTRIE